MEEELSSLDGGEKMRSYVKWVDSRGSYEAYEFRSHVQLNQRRSDTGQQITSEITFESSWSHSTNRSGTTFLFHGIEKTPGTVVAPANIAALLLAWLHRVGGSAT